MPEVLPAGTVNRWYELRLVGKGVTLLFAEKYFDSEAEASQFWERRCGELGQNRVHRPVPSHEDARVWAVCVEPQEA